MNEDEYPRLIRAAAQFCLAESPHEFLCTEDPNHDGDHRTVLRGEVLDRWPQQDLEELADE